MIVCHFCRYHQDRREGAGGVHTAANAEQAGATADPGRCALPAAPAAQVALSLTTASSSLNPWMWRANSHTYQCQEVTILQYTLANEVPPHDAWQRYTEIGAHVRPSLHPWHDPSLISLWAPLHSREQPRRPFRKDALLPFPSCCWCVIAGMRKGARAQWCRICWMRWWLPLWSDHWSRSCLTATFWTALLVHLRLLQL